MASRSAVAAPATSSAVSPLTRSPISKAAVSVAVASPRIRTENAAAALSLERDAPRASSWTAWRRAAAAMAASVTGERWVGGISGCKKTYPKNRAFVNWDKDLRSLLGGSERTRFRA